MLAWKEWYWWYNVVKKLILPSSSCTTRKRFVMSMPAQIQWKLQVFCKWDTDAGKFVWYVLSKHTSISLVSTPHHNAVRTEQNRPNHYIDGHRHRNCCWVSLSQINESLDIPVSSWRMVHHIRPVLCVCQSWSTSGLEWFCTISKKHPEIKKSD